MITVSFPDVLDLVLSLDLHGLASLPTWNYRNQHLSLKMRKPRHEKLINLTAIKMPVSDKYKTQPKMSSSTLRNEPLQNGQYWLKTKHSIWQGMTLIHMQRLVPQHKCRRLKTNSAKILNHSLIVCGHNCCSNSHDS